jgi:uncharacterized membrane protein
MITQPQVLKLGMMLILLGFVVVFLSSLMPIQGQKSDVKFGFFGELPFGLGSDKKTVIITVALAVFLLVVGYLFLQMNR